MTLKLHSIGLVLGGLLLLANPTFADEADPGKRVKEVVAAVGGEEHLLKQFQFSDLVLIASTPTAPVTANDKPNRTQVVDVGGHVWIGKTPRNKDKVRVLIWAWSLRILLEPKSKIASIDDLLIADKPAFGLRVTESVKEPIELYFDKETRRLVAIDYTDTRHLFTEWKKAETGEAYPSHVAGYRFTDKATGKLADKQWYQTDIIELTVLKSLPPELNP